jgi:hypothetical protein
LHLTSLSLCCAEACRDSQRLVLKSIPCEAVELDALKSAHSLLL